MTTKPKRKPEPTLKDVAMQVGVHFEEVAEMMEATNNDSTETYELAEFYKQGYGNFVPYLQPNGKIGKNPATYQAPNLTPYLKPLNPDPDNSYGGSHE